jgi:ribosomal protein L7/L12
MNMDEGSVIWIIAIAALVFIAVFNTAVNNLRSDIRRLDNKLEKIAKAVGIADEDSVEENVVDEIRALVIAGKKIQAIKMYRAVTGYGLKEAKDYVDSLDKELI